MNETRRERNDLQSGGMAAGSNVELETTTTTIQESCPTGSPSMDGSQKSAAERAKAERDQIRERAGQASEQVRRSAAEAGEQVRRRTRETAQLVREQAGEQAAALKHRAVEQIDCQKNGFATKICDVSGALKRAADDLEQHEDHQLAVQTRRLAEGIEGMGNHLRDSQVSDLLADTEAFVRRNPALTLGGLFVAGLTLARFLKARPPRHQNVGFQSPTGGPAGGMQSSGMPAGGGVNPYLQRQQGATERLPHDHELTVGSSDLKYGSTDPTAGHRVMGSQTAGSQSMGSPSAGTRSAIDTNPAMSTNPPMGTKPGDMPGGTASHASSAGITPATTAEANRSSTDSAACPTPTAKSSQEDTSPGATPQGINPQSSPSGNRNPGGSAPRPR